MRWWTVPLLWAPLVQIRGSWSDIHSCTPRTQRAQGILANVGGLQLLSRRPKAARTPDLRFEKKERLSSLHSMLNGNFLTDTTVTGLFWKLKLRRWLPHKMLNRLVPEFFIKTSRLHIWFTWLGSWSQEAKLLLRCPRLFSDRYLFHSIWLLFFSSKDMFTS